MPKPSRFLRLSGLQGLTVLGILAATPAIAIPILTCGPAPLPEGSMTVGTMNRAQQAYRLENNSFAPTVAALGTRILTRTQRYNYSTQATPTAAFNYGIARNAQTYSYVGGVFLVPGVTPVNSKAASDELTTVAILCVAEQPGTLRPSPPTLQNGQPTCAKGTVPGF